MMNENCPCKKSDCPRHGRCEECRAYHAASKRQRPVACERKSSKPAFKELLLVLLTLSCIQCLLLGIK